MQKLADDVRMCISSWSLTVRVKLLRCRCCHHLLPVLLEDKQRKLRHVAFEHCAYDITPQACQLDPTLFLTQMLTAICELSNGGQQKLKNCV